jgi:peptidoglycan/xylan/chitin deacetylase (PgdA/CDA1 family)
MEVYMNYYLRFPEGRLRAVTLSYDDGVVQDERFLDIINRYGLKCTFNINGIYVDPNVPYVPSRRMDRQQATALYCGERGEGHEIAAHGYTHPFLHLMPSDRITYEVIKDREVLEGMMGRVVRGFAYPYGACNDEVVDMLKKCGIAYARTTQSTHDFGIPTDWLRMPATCHHNDPKLLELVDSFLSDSTHHIFKKWPRLFYLWGHTYEFDDHNNWEVIEKFAEKIGNREDVWYATNIEVYDYVEAYRALKFSADGSCVYNPSALTVWFAIEDKEIKVEPGQTLKIR